MKRVVEETIILAVLTILSEHSEYYMEQIQVAIIVEQVQNTALIGTTQIFSKVLENYLISLLESS